ncbi:MAG: UDP-glucose 4-epimerase GalE [Verrucomicrobiia bacterium]
MILVIGGAGYIGSHMVKWLVQHGEDVLVMDNFEKGHREAVTGVRVVEADLRRREDLDKVFRQYDIECVMHFAAYASVGDSVRNPATYYENNVAGCYTLLEAMRARNIDRMIFSSSAAVYGEPKEIPIPEHHQKVPTNPYGETKRVMENMLQWYDVAYGMRSISLRYFNAAGADPDGRIGEDHDPEEHLIPVALLAALGQRDQLSVFGTDWPTPDGTCIRDYIHVCDLAEAHHLAINALRAGAKTTAYNLGNGQGFSVKDVIRVVEEVTGRTVPVKATPRRPGDPARLVAGSERIRQELGWRPKYAQLEVIVQHAWNWRKANPNGYQP